VARPGPGSRDPAEVTAKIDGVVVRSSASSVTEACCRAARLESEGYPTQRADPCIQSIQNLTLSGLEPRAAGAVVWQSNTVKDCCY
jgi:hypothetical protein